MRKYIIWGIVILLTLGVGLGGVFKLIKLSMFVENAEALNYSATFGQMIGTLEIIGSIGLYFSRWRIWASIGLGVILIGAIGVSVGAAAGVEHHLGPAIPLLLCITLILIDRNYRLVKTNPLQSPQ